MGQVPAGKIHLNSRILIVGDGRLASALLEAAKSQSQETKCTILQWTRRSPLLFSDIVSQFKPTHVWLAISDRAIPGFVEEHATIFAGVLGVHFAGSLSSLPHCHAAHPLMTFANKKTAQQTEYKFSDVPFVLDESGPELNELMPGFTNPSFRIDGDQRSYYHALCSIAGNFSTLLWESVGHRLEDKLNLPKSILNLYRRQIFTNLDGAGSVLTGPIAREDFITIKKHQDALLEKFEMPLLKIYDGFLDLHRTDSNQTKGTM